MDIVTLFCEIDDFCTHLEPWLHRHLLPTRQRERASRMHLSEVMTILVWFHMVGYRNFKQFYMPATRVHRFTQKWWDIRLPAIRLSSYIQCRGS